MARRQRQGSRPASTAHAWLMASIRQAAQAAGAPQTAAERASIAETQRQLAEQRSHDTKMAAAAGVAGVVAGAALMHHHDASATQVHIDATNAAQQNTFVRNVSYGDDFSDDAYDDGYNDGYNDGYDDAMEDADDDGPDDFDDYDDYDDNGFDDGGDDFDDFDV